MNGFNCSNTPALNHQNGLTLIEIVICMGIFAIGFLAIASLVIATTRNNTTGNMLTQATMLTREKIEHLKSLPLEELENACQDDMAPEIVEGVYSWVCTVSALGSSTTIKTIKVAVEWKNLGRTRQVVLETNTRGRGQ